MFANYEIDFGKINWNWCHSLNIQQDEIEEALELGDLAWLYLLNERQFEILVFTKHRKFLAVSFIFNATDQIVIEDIKLPDYGTIQQAVIRRIVEAG